MGACLEFLRDRETSVSNREYVRRRIIEDRIREVREETNHVGSCMTLGGLCLVLEDGKSLECLVHRCGMI